MIKKKQLFIPVLAGKTFFHDSRELIESDIKYLMDEVHRVAKQHDLPFHFIMETEFNEAGNGFCYYGAYPKERLRVLGFTARALLGHFLVTADQADIEAACQLLIKKKLIQ